VRVVGDVRRLRADDLMQIPNCGKAVVEELKVLLAPGARRAAPGGEALVRIIVDRLVRPKTADAIRALLDREPI
jgi:hypothetical protein